MNRHDNFPGGSPFRDPPEQEEPSDEEVGLELGLPPNLGSGLMPDPKLREVEQEILANVERLDSQSGVIHMVEAVRDLVRMMETIRQEQMLTRRILYHRGRQQDRLTTLTQENRQWQTNFGSNASKLLWIVITVLMGLFLTQVYESFLKPRESISVAGPVTVQNQPLPSHTPPGSR